MPADSHLFCRLTIIGLVIGSLTLIAQPVNIWRHFTATDGLIESYVGAVSVGVKETVWITHGQTSQMTTFDGFSVQHLPSPGIDTHVEESAVGEVWAMDIRPGSGAAGFRVLSESSWKTFPVSDFAPQDPELLITAAGAQRFVPFVGGRVVYPAKDGLREFSSKESRSRSLRITGCTLGSIRSVAASRSTGFWVAGERGIGRVSAWPSSDGSVNCVPWGGAVPHTWSEFSNLFEDGDSVFASVRDGEKTRLLISLTRETRRVITRTTSSETGICGWSAGAGAAWILRVTQGEQKLFLLSPHETNEVPAPKSKVLSGRITDIVAQPAGVSWIATTLGLARVAPPVWQPVGPPAVSSKGISAIVETPSKDMAYLGVNTLWIHSGDRLLERRLPLPLRRNFGLSNRMAALSNGKIAIPVHPIGAPGKLLVYDPSRDTFVEPTISDYENCAFVAARSGGRAWAACQTPAQHLMLFSYDGTRFDRSFEVPTLTRNEWPRVITEARDGSIWIGAFWEESLFRYSNGSMARVDLPPDASGMGVSDIAELPDGRMWFGGRNMVIEHSGSGWRVVRRNLETVRAIYKARDGAIWIAAGAGVTQCREDTCVLHDARDGLPEGVAWTVFEDSQRRLMVGTTAGVRLHNGSADRDPPVVEMSRQLNVTSFAPGGEIRLVPTATDRWRFTESDRLLFSFRLDGRAWTPFEPLTVVSLRQIASGDHTLDIRPMDRNLNVGLMVSWPFSVLVLWYRQPAWIVSTAFAGLVLAFSFYQHWTRHRELGRAVTSTTQRLKSDFETHSRIQARFEAILDHAPTLIYVKDLEGRYIISNLRHSAVLGMSRQQILGKSDDELFGPGSAPPFQAGETEALEKQTAIQLEETDPRSSKTYLAIKFPIHDAANAPSAICGILTDITESKQAQARVQLSQRLETVGLLAGGVAHDFNNLLTIINSYSELLLEEAPVDSPLRTGLSEIRSAGEHAAGLTAQLLAFSRQQVIRPTVLGPGHVIADLQKMLRRLIGEDIELVTRVAPDVGNVKMDATQLQQIVMNLALNARDAMPDGGRLLIEAENVDFQERTSKQPDMHPGGYVMIAVSDTGTGMSPEVQARVFEPFFTTKELGKGTGLGLATVYGMVKQSGGWIWLYSEVGRGSTFKVYLPRTDDLAGSTEATPKADLKGDETILVVEDQPEVRALAVSALQKYGYTVYEACAGAEALSFVNNFSAPLSLLVTDVVMPGMNGQELAHRLNAIRPGVKVLFVSGYTDRAATVHGVNEPGFRYLQKPFTPESLATVVRELLGPRQSGAES